MHECIQFHDGAGDSGSYYILDRLTVWVTHLNTGDRGEKKIMSERERELKLKNFILQGL